MESTAFNRYYGNDRAAKVVYGSILIFAYLMTQNHSKNATALSLVSGTFFAAVTIVLAEVYAEILGKTIHQKKAPQQASTPRSQKRFTRNYER